MKSIVLAAGRGTRLQPHTNNVPKCLVELAGVSLLERHAAALRQAGITDITVVGGYRSEAIEARGFKVVRNPAFDRTNMVETLFCARKLMDGNCDILISYGDIVFETRVIEAIAACDSPICVTVDSQWRRYWERRMVDPLTDAETLKLDGNGCIRELGKKPLGYDEIQGQYMGLVKVRADHVLKLCSMRDAMDRDAIYDGKDFTNMYMTSFLQHLIDANWVVQAVPVENGWLEVDTVEDLALYQDLHAEGTLDTFYRLDA